VGALHVAERGERDCSSALVATQSESMFEAGSTLGFGDTYITVGDMLHTL